MTVTAASIEPHIPALRRFARALLRDASAADDLVHDCLERALSRWTLRRRDGDLKAWLFTIMYNLHVSNRRREARQGTAVDITDWSDAVWVDASQEHHIAVRDTLTGLFALPEDQRAVIMMIAVEDMSYEDAAKALDIPVGTVMSRLSRGRERLRRILSGDEEAARDRPPALRRVK